MFVFDLLCCGGGLSGLLWLFADLVGFTWVVLRLLGLWMLLVATWCIVLVTVCCFGCCSRLLMCFGRFRLIALYRFWCM